MFGRHRAPAETPNTRLASQVEHLTAQLAKQDESIAAFRRTVVDHILTGRRHPDAAVRIQAFALQTELDAAGLSVDAEVRASLTGAA